MKKSFITVHGLIGILLIVTVFAILLRTTGLISLILQNAGEDTKCQASFIGSAMTKTIGKTVIDPKCKTNRITFVVDSGDAGQTETGGEKKALLYDYPSNLKGMPKDTYARVETWNDIVDDTEEYPDNLKYTYIDDSEYIEDFRAIYDGNQDSEDAYVTMRYNMDYLMAEELQRIWEIVGRGNLPLFDNYWKFIGCKQPDGSVDPCESEETFWRKLSNLEERPYATFCVLGARVKFDEEVQQLMTKDEYSTINQWMKVNPYATSVPGPTGTPTKESYYEYVIDDSLGEVPLLQMMPYFSYSTDEPQAIVFIRYNWHQGVKMIIKGSEISQSILARLPIYEKKFEGKNIYYLNSLEIVPYSQLASKCDYIVGSYV